MVVEVEIEVEMDEDGTVVPLSIMDVRIDYSTRSSVVVEQLQNTTASQKLKNTRLFTFLPGWVG